MQNTSTTRTRKRKAFSSVRMQDPQLWERAAWLSSIYTEDESAFVPVQEYCDTFVKHQGLNCGYRDMWNILKLAFPSVEKVRRGRKYVYWGIRRNAERPEKKSRKQPKGRKSAANIEAKRKGTPTRSKETSDHDTKADNISVQEMHDDSHVDKNVNFIVHLGTSRVEVEHEPHQVPETPTTSSADNLVAALPSNETNRSYDNPANFDEDPNSSACMVTVTDVSVQTQSPNMESEPVTSSDQDGACAEGGALRKSVETQWTGEEFGISARPRCPHGAEADDLAGVRVKQEPFWGSEDEDGRPTFVSAAAFSSAPRTAADSPAPALVPFPADNPPTASSIERLKECIDRIPQESLISKHATFSNLHPSFVPPASFGETPPTTGLMHLTSLGQSPSPRPIQVSVGTQHKASTELAGFATLCREVVLDKSEQDNRFSERAVHSSGLNLSPDQSETRMSSGNFQVTSGNLYQSECEETAVRGNSEKAIFPAGSAPLSQSVAPDNCNTANLSSDHLSTDKDALPMIVSVMSYAVPESNGVNPAHAQDARPLTIHQEGSRDREQPLKSEARLRSEIQYLRDGLLEERRLRRSAETQLSKCLLQLSRQRAVSDQLAEALKPFIFKKQT